MADTVRNLMEAMVPELEDYERRGYFSRAEISAIVKRRQHFEYNLRRRNSRKEDFLRYYEHEWKLEQLRRHRRKERNISGKRSLADYGIVRRIHFVFERATRKFKGDLTIWMAWLKFCKESHSTQQVSKVITKALKLHPATPFLWTYAAAWEFESNANPVAARLLMQSGLRNCPHDSSLWLEYFRMELLYANKLIARRKALGIDLSKEAGAPDADALILSGRLAQLVHDQAVSKTREDVRLRRRFLQIAASIPCHGTQQLQQHIAKSMRDDFGTDAEGCVILAECIRDRLTGSGDGGVPAACTFLCDRVRETQSPDLQAAAVSFIASEICALDALSRGEGTTVAAMQCDALLDVLDMCAAEAIDGEQLPRVAVLQCEARLRRGDVAGARALIEAAAAAGADWRALEQLLRLAAANATQRGGSVSGAGELVGRVLEGGPSEERWRLWCPALGVLVAAGESCSVVTDAVVAALRVKSLEPLGDVVAAVLSAIWHAYGADEAADFADRIEACPTPGVEYWSTRIQMLCQQCSSAVEATGAAAHTIVATFEKAVSAHGHESVDLWLMWVHWMVSAGRAFGDITWRATRALEGGLADDFSAAVQALEAE